MQEGGEEDFLMKAYHNQQRRRKADVEVKLSDWNYYWSAFLVIGFFGSGSAQTPADCQEIDLKTFPNPEISFDESLFFTVLANQKESWSFSATISDLNGVKCSFGVRRHERNRNEYLLCPGTGHNYNSAASENDYQNTSEKTEVSFDADRRLSCVFKNESFTSCGRSVRITLPQLFVIKGYNPKWIQTTLEPPMKMTVDNTLNANLTINCKNLDCLQTSGTLKKNMAYKRNVFFLKPADSFQEVHISAGGCDLKVNKSSLQVYNGPWFNITLEHDSGWVKVHVDGRESHKELCQRKDFFIESVKLTGRGLLTWCDPRGGRKALDLKMIVIALLGVILAMFVIIIYCAKRRPSSTVQEEVATAPSTSQAANHQGRHHESAVYEYVEVGAFVNTLTSHESENSLYEASNFHLEQT
ncbi:uncharacterized protein [Macrobrachium rosenbergii]|uniref:uncharacterized protein isoform X2 n=1 Tax=Macrobrachium rosenbergii TaxID=79674 RepID=UPI0034D5ACAE